MAAAGTNIQAGQTGEQSGPPPLFNLSNNQPLWAAPESALVGLAPIKMTSALL
jgi:hypothetical protein